MDNKLKKLLRHWKEESGSTRVIQFKYRKGILQIFTSQPGLLIGKGGVLVNKYEQIFKNELHGFQEVEFIETNYYSVYL